MLRGSGEASGIPIDLGAVGNPTVDAGVAGSAEILRAVDAAVLRDSFELPDARAALIETLGKAAAVRTFAVAGNFEMMNRLLDAIGVGPPERLLHLAPRIGISYR